MTLCLVVVSELFFVFLAVPEHLNYIRCHSHPKTLIEMWITCLDPVSANSEKCIGSQWAVRVGQRLQSRFEKSGVARKLGLVQIIVEASSIRRRFKNT